MNLLAYFSEQLKIGNQNLNQSEKMWDKRAKDFYHNQIQGSHYFAEEVPKILQSKRIIDKSMCIIDISTGSGRFVIPFVKMSEHIYALDLSNNILNFIKEEIKKSSTNKFTHFKIDLAAKKYP